MEENVALKLRVSGVVQGVGFRPFVYRIAVKNGIKGYVKNLGGSEVEIHAEGSLLNILSFIRDLVVEKPPPAEIEILEIEESKPKVFKEFSILKSGKNPKMFSMIPPDIGICDDCLREILDRNSRWYMYPFNSCAWCGPRFSIIEKIPYDRENTSMRDFPLCEECLSEYRDPENIRRFHAQGISCPKCGPKVWLVDNSGELVETDDPIKFAAKLIDEGYIVAIKGLGGFHIAALATNDEVVLTLRERKRRPQKPFALMALNIDVVRKIAYVPREAEELLLSPQKPIVLLPKRENTPISEYVAPGLSTIGVMLPYTGLHYILLMYTKDKYLIMT
ncbi:MAG: carbamoyltransferase HypF, partial [Desulfurococcales archaeon ex4484_217_2]